MKYKFQHFVDIATSAETMQIINFDVGGRDVINRCAHLFNAYRYFKLGKISVKFVPASTLPVDPLGLSYDDEDPQTVDPRDQLNCGLVRITNGEDIMTDLGGISAEVQEQMYNAMLLDPRWYKFSLQGGFKRSARPLFWQIGQLHQDQFPGAHFNVPVIPSNDTVGAVNTASVTVVNSDLEDGYYNMGQFMDNHYSSAAGMFQTGHRGRLGYLPTDAYQYIYSNSSHSDLNGFKPMVHPVPSIQTITCVLPKMHKTNYYYRVYITEEVYFSGLRSIAPTNAVGYNYRGIDDFIKPPMVAASAPNAGSFATISPPQNPMNDGTDSRQIL